MTRTINSGKWMQEWHETAARTARSRARELRLQGYVVTVANMGTQITEVGAIKMTLIDVRPGTHEDTFGVQPLTW